MINMGGICRQPMMLPLVSFMSVSRTALYSSMVARTSFWYFSSDLNSCSLRVSCKDWTGSDPGGVAEEDAIMWVDERR